jgi:hypothetical protein
VETATGATRLTVAQAPQSPQYGSDITTGRTTMTPAQAAQYRAEYNAAKEKWSKMTPQEQAATIASARQKKIADLSAIERVGQRADMMKETAAQSGALKAQSEAAEATWAKMTPAQKQAARKASWQKKRDELDGIERVGQRDDTDILPW